MAGITVQYQILFVCFTIVHLSVNIIIFYKIRFYDQIKDMKDKRKPGVYILV